MDKIGIITITDTKNYGNRLQNYAVEKYISKYGYMVETMWKQNKLKDRITDYMEKIYPEKSTRKKYKSFKKFTSKNIKTRHIKDYMEVVGLEKEYKYIIVGSDQIWNFRWQLDKNLPLVEIPSEKIVSFSASFGTSDIDDKFKDFAKKLLKHIGTISVREFTGKELIEKYTGRKDAKVLIDPTMLLTSEEWDKLSKKPKQFDGINGKKYILNFFLGELSDSRKKEIERIAKENNCEIINMLDKNDPFYTCGPSEFLYLEKHAFLICTDSFHSSIFAVLFDRPFVVFDREQKNIENMSSRIDTLISKFNLKNRKYNGKKITKENLNHDYTEAYKTLKTEREKSKKFIEKALDIK